MNAFLELGRKMSERIIKKFGQNKNDIVELSGKSVSESSGGDLYSNVATNTTNSDEISTYCPNQKHKKDHFDACICYYQALLKSIVKTEDFVQKWHFNEETELKDIVLQNPVVGTQGGQGIVFTTINVETKQILALKLKAKLKKKEEIWNIEKREMTMMKVIDHPFIVKAVSYFETTTAMVLIFEFLHGGCLWNRIVHDGLLNDNEASYVCACIILALEYLHAKEIVYRDLKAENIVLDATLRPKLIDFGMAKSIVDIGDEESERPLTDYSYTAYLAPEIYGGPNVHSFMMDSWGIGYLAVEMVFGFGIIHPIPWNTRNAPHLTPDWEFQLDKSQIAQHVEISDFIHQMIRRNPTDRMNLEEAKHHLIFKDTKWESLYTKKSCIKLQSADESETELTVVEDEPLAKREGVPILTDGHDKNKNADRKHLKNDIISKVRKLIGFKNSGAAYNDVNISILTNQQTSKPSSQVFTLGNLEPVI